MIAVAAHAGIRLGVVSQHRFDDAILFLKRAIAEDRLGRILQADAYVKWFRSAEYYSRPVKGSWAVEGGGALINQAIHQVDLLLYLAGPITRMLPLAQARPSRHAAAKSRNWRSNGIVESRQLIPGHNCCSLRSMNLDTFWIPRPHGRRTLQDSGCSTRIAKRVAQQVLRLDRV
jgi:predicted dehydrogenase